MRWCRSWVVTEYNTITACTSNPPVNTWSHGMKRHCEKIKARTCLLLRATQEQPGTQIHKAAPPWHKGVFPITWPSKLTGLGMLNMQQLSFERKKIFTGQQRVATLARKQVMQCVRQWRATRATSVFSKHNQWGQANESSFTWQAEVVSSRVSTLIQYQNKLAKLKKT